MQRKLGNVGEKQIQMQIDIIKCSKQAQNNEDAISDDTIRNTLTPYS